ncbi:MAG: hypothetical protein JSS86_23325 [Cyanobacteria bacterium SZAS LIN-2]|nr:hypothetical protein [Cyanobacteria bacterium SZAS LIN-2]
MRTYLPNYEDKKEKSAYMNPPKNIQEIVEPIKPFIEALISIDSMSLSCMVPNWQTCEDSVLQVLKSDPATLSIPPEEGFRAISYNSNDEEQEYLPQGWKFPMMYVYQTKATSWDVDLFLWGEQGLSDLAVSLVIQDTPAGPRITELHDIRVQ